MKNRYGMNYSFEKIDDTHYRFVIEKARYMRYGGGPDKLEFVDPEGGPFISEGYEIDGRKVVALASTDDGIILEVK